MTIRISTGLKNAMLGEIGLKAALADGVIRVYTGAQPVNPDSPATGTLLAEITVDGGAFTHGSPTNGLEWDAPADGEINKPSGVDWKGAGIAAGTAGWARFCGNTLDEGGSSTTLARIDMSVGKTTGDLQLSTINIVVGTPITVDQAQLVLP